MTVTTSIPIIDISAEGTDQAQVAKELVDAAVEYGFVYIRNAGRDISTEHIENAFNIVCIRCLWIDIVFNSTITS